MASSVGKFRHVAPVRRTAGAVAVQAVAVFFPVTDLLNLGPSTENPGDGGPPISFVKAFGPDSKNMARWKEIGRRDSPIYHVHTKLPPILIRHGDADTLVPISNSERAYAAFKEARVETEFIIMEGAGHGFRGEQATEATAARVKWFVDHPAN